MLIRNKKQGSEWDITDPAHIKRLLAKPAEYEEVKPVVEHAKPDAKKPEK
jgi:hypothetical protein